jgi:hypothetical protein
MDRRERWKKVAPISGEYNTIRVGEVVSARQKTFRELGTILMTALGEPSADVSVLPTNIYPPVSWECEPVIEAGELACQRVSVLTVKVAPLLMVHASPAVLAPPTSNDVVKLTKEKLKPPFAVA